MVVANAIRHHAYLIRQLVAWLEEDVQEGGFARASSTSIFDLNAAEATLRTLADEIAERRAALIANAPKRLQAAE